MKNFRCSCGNTLYFTNTQCLQCGKVLGFIPAQMTLRAFDIDASGAWVSSIDQQRYKPCHNYSQHHTCNWMLPYESTHQLCDACRLTDTIPDLSRPGNIPLWYRMEQAKRHLLYTLCQLGLPVLPHNTTGVCPTFRFLEDVYEDEFGQELTIKSTVVTGHFQGIITLNLKEAEDASRVLMREQLNERYRTLIGHFRHESGHYFWDRLVAQSSHLHAFRQLFGDERLNYTQALHSYYTHGPVYNWQETWITAYASMHPWEDWAESWAHYLHMVDTLETATNYELSLQAQPVQNPLMTQKQADADKTSFDAMFADWCRLTNMLNALNRSMGLDDAYPFVIPEPALGKLKFIHALVLEQQAMTFPNQIAVGG